MRSTVLNPLAYNTFNTHAHVSPHASVWGCKWCLHTDLPPAVCVFYQLLSFAFVLIKNRDGKKHQGQPQECTATTATTTDCDNQSVITDCCCLLGSGAWGEGVRGMKHKVG